MKHTRSRHQNGSVRKVPRANGFAWEYRYYTSEAGKRVLKTQTFDSVKYPTENSVREVIAPHLKEINTGTYEERRNATMSVIIDRYFKEEFPDLSHSTQSTNKSLIDLWIRPKWGDVRPADVDALSVDHWLKKELKFGAASKARARNMISVLLRLAMLWKYMPQVANPMTFVRVKGSTKRQKKIIIITPAQLKSLVEALPEPYSLMVLVAGCLGLRVSEVLALKWQDFNFDECSVTINQVFTHSQVKELPKTEASGEPLPVHPHLIPILQAWKAKQKHDYSWVFPFSRTGSPYSDSTILTDHLKPAAEKLGIKGLGWHTFRHSYKSWLAAAKVEPGHMKQLMRHADISTTMNVYGRVVTEEMRAANLLAAGQLL
jgi:integrase